MKPAVLTRRRPTPAEETALLDSVRPFLEAGERLWPADEVDLVELHIVDGPNDVDLSAAALASTGA